MTIKNVVLMCAFTLLFTISSYAQLNILNAKTPDEIGVKTDEQKAYDNDGPLPYGYVDDRDVLWSKTTWEKIDLNERMNFPLYYQIDYNILGRVIRSIYHLLFSYIRSVMI